VVGDVLMKFVECVVWLCMSLGTIDTVRSIIVTDFDMSVVNLMELGVVRYIYQ
jgi:hypothetical protein